MNQEQTAYADPQAPNGQRLPEAPPPGWYTSAMGRISEAIAGVIMHEQHEYLEHKRLPHTIKTSEVLVKPYLMKDGQLAIATVFPVASELSYVCCFQPIYDRGYSIYDGKIPDEVEVLGYNLFVYKENGPLAVNNQPILMADFMQAELCRIGREMNLRYSQFVYITLVTPTSAAGFEDPHNNLANLIPRTNPVEEQAETVNAPAQPTPID